MLQQLVFSFPKFYDRTYLEVHKVLQELHLITAELKTIGLTKKNKYTQSGMKISTSER